MHVVLSIYTCEVVKSPQGVSNSNSHWSTVFPAIIDQHHISYVNLHEFTVGCHQKKETCSPNACSLLEFWGHQQNLNMWALEIGFLNCRWFFWWNPILFTTGFLGPWLVKLHGAPAFLVTSVMVPLQPINNVRDFWLFYGKKKVYHGISRSV